MNKWLKISLLLCTFGFLRELRPNEPFVTEYLAGDWFNLTSEQVNKEVYPFGTYAILSQLVIVFLVTDILRYKPIIVLSACAGITLFSVLLWSRTVHWLQFGQMFFGFFTASEVAYYTYIYAKVDKSYYQQVTGHTRAAILCGKFLGGVLAQVLVSTKTMSYRELHFITLATQIMSFFVAIVLPSVPKSLYFYAETLPESGDQAQAGNNETAAPKFSIMGAIRLLWKHTVSAYTNPVVVQWSIWWAFASCGLILTISYIQFLWKEISPGKESVYNGGVEATATLLGAVSALLAGLLSSNRHKGIHMLLVTICTLVMGGLLIFASITNNVWVTYINYILFCIIYFFVITIASTMVAENLLEESFGLIFGINTLVGCILNTIMTIVFVTDTGYGLPPRQQYQVYGSYFIILAIAYFIIVAVTYLLKVIRKGREAA